RDRGLARGGTRGRCRPVLNQQATLATQPVRRLGGTPPCYAHLVKTTGRYVMRAATLWTLAAIAVLGLSGCNRAESPPKVQQNVAKATDEAAEKDAQAADRLAKADAAASQDVAKAEARADEKTTDAAGDAVIAQAEGDHKVAVAQCEALSG